MKISFNPSKEEIIPTSVCCRIIRNNFSTLIPLIGLQWVVFKWRERWRRGEVELNLNDYLYQKNSAEKHSSHLVAQIGLPSVDGMKILFMMLQSAYTQLNF